MERRKQWRHFFLPKKQGNDRHQQEGKQQEKNIPSIKLIVPQNCDPEHEIFEGY